MIGDKSYIYDMINSLNKNLARYFVWCLEKEKRYEFGTLSIDRVLNKEHFLAKVCTKLVSDVFLVWSVTQNSHCILFEK